MAASIIRIKRSSVSGKIPSANDVPLGELALNTYDGKLYASKNVGIGTTVFAVNPWSVGLGSNTYNTFFTAGSVGIGTTDPTRTLDVNGDIRLRGGLYVGAANTSGTFRQVLQSTGLGVTWSSNGIIGIGTEFPSSALNGDLFYSAEYAKLFVYYDEDVLGIGTDAFWVDAAPFNVGVITSTHISFVPGSATLPSMFFVGDSQTGFFSPASGQLTIVSTGASVLNVNPSGIRVTGVSTFGNTVVGGGTTQLIVTGDARITGILTVGTGSITLDGSTNTISGITTINTTSINGGPLAGFRNAIINGGMQVAQRAAPTITGAPQYGQADRFVAYISGGTGISGTISQSADAQFKSGYRLWLANLSYTSGTWAIQQRIESFNSIGLNGSTVTVSFKLYHDFGSSRTVGVGLAKANAVDNFSSATAIASVYTSPALTSGAYSNVSCSFVIGASDATNGLLLQIADSSATTVSAKNLIIGDVQLEIGPVATPFERRPIGTELALCQRYYESSAGGASFASAILFNGRVVTGINFNARLRFSVTKRATPTVTLTNEFSSAFSTTPNVNGTDIYGFQEARLCNTTTDLGIFSSHWTASAEL